MEWSLGKSLSKFYPTTPLSNQDDAIARVSITKDPKDNQKLPQNLFNVRTQLKIH